MALTPGTDEELHYSFHLDEISLVSVLRSLAMTLRPISAIGANQENFALPDRMEVDPDSMGVYIEDDKAHDVTISLHGDELTMDQALTLASEASGCNIFQDGITIVIDWCDI